MKKKDLDKVIKINYALDRLERHCNDCLYYSSKDKKNIKFYEELKKVKTQILNLRVDHTVYMNDLKDKNSDD